MAMVLSGDEIVKIILKYINDKRRFQAILLDGDWGCGKTFFINNHLLPELDKCENIRYFKISLYGVSDVESIQNMIYASWLEDYMRDKTQNLGQFGKAIKKGIGIFGKSAISLVESKIGTDDVVNEVSGKLIEEQLSKEEQIVFIFDDIERCQTDIIELMGFLNNLSENNGFKLILVANEKEINRRNNVSETALKYIVSLNSRIENRDNGKNGNTENGKQGENSFTKEDLENISNNIFGQESIYEKTKEKLVGLTIPYSISIMDVFDSIAVKYIIDEDTRQLVISYKEEIIDTFEYFNHKNLRTVISACIAIEDILTAVDEEQYLHKDILYNEIKKVILYTVYSSIRKANGKQLYKWNNNNRYACVYDGLVDRITIYGYAFVDEYLTTQSVDRQVIFQDLSIRVKDEYEVSMQRKESLEHSKLALYQLSEWYFLPDADVMKHVEQMKMELLNKEYLPQEFKEIICILMSINNPDFGLQYKETDIISRNLIYDTSDATQFADMQYENTARKEEYIHPYSKWKTYDIKEYVEIMLEYFEDPDTEINIDMMSVLTEDKEFAYEYRRLILPIIEKIKEREIKKASQSEDGTDICDMDWNENFIKFISAKKNDYIKQGKFISLYDFGKMTSRLEQASAKEIHTFCESMKIIYSFSNLSRIYSADYDSLNDFLNYIEKNKGKTINIENSRAKEIALFRLLTDLESYKERLSYDL